MIQEAIPLSYSTTTPIKLFNSNLPSTKTTDPKQDGPKTPEFSPKALKFITPQESRKRISLKLEGNSCGRTRNYFIRELILSRFEQNDIIMRTLITPHSAAKQEAEIQEEQEQNLKEKERIQMSRSRSKDRTINKSATLILSSLDLSRRSQKKRMSMIFKDKVKRVEEGDSKVKRIRAILQDMRDHMDNDQQKLPSAFSISYY